MIVPAQNIVETVDLTADDALLPILECVVNSIISLQKSNIPQAQKEIQIKIIRGESINQQTILDVVKTIKSCVITDNGVGFTDENYKSFETPFSKINKSYGCKGIGRFTVLAAFDSLKVESNYFENSKWYARNFKFDSVNEVQIDEEKTESIDTEYKTVVTLNNCHNPIIKEKSALSIFELAEKIMQHCLIYYLNNNLPKIVIYDTENGQVTEDTATTVINELFEKVSKEKEKTFDVHSHSFKMYVTKTIKVGNRKNNYVHYCANSRVVGNPKNIKTFNSLFNYPITSNGQSYFLDIYVVSDYLNKKAYSARNGFKIAKEKDNPLLVGSAELTFQDIEEKITSILEQEYNTFVRKSREKSINDIKSYITNKAPRYKSFINQPEVLNSIPPGLHEDKLEEHLYKISYNARKSVESQINKFITEQKITEQSISQIKDSIKAKTAYDVDSLADYMTRRKAILDLFSKFLDADINGDYKLEKDVHNLIFPMGFDNGEILYDNHNLWILDERFMNYRFIASDKSITSMSQKNSRKEPDLVMFDNPMGFGNRNAGEINSMVIFEFKRPGEVAHQKPRKDYRWEFSELVEPYFDEFMYAQDKRNYKGNQVILKNTTPKFGYIVVDVLPPQLVEYNENSKGWNRTPFGTYFKIITGINLHLEVMTFQTLLKIANDRHTPFFNKLFA